MFKFSICFCDSIYLNLNFFYSSLNSSLSPYALLSSFCFTKVISDICLVFCSSDFFKASNFLAKDSYSFWSVFNAAVFYFNCGSNSSHFWVRLFLVVSKFCLNFWSCDIYSSFCWIVFLRFLRYSSITSAFSNSDSRPFLSEVYLSRLFLNWSICLLSSSISL